MRGTKARTTTRTAMGGGLGTKRLTLTAKGKKPTKGKMSAKMAGLDWSIVSKRRETREQHIRQHLFINTSKTKHGVFNNKNFKAVLNDAWKRRGSATVTYSGNTQKYIIPYPNAGTEGGSDGTGTKLNYICIIVSVGTNQIITGFPCDLTQP